MQSVILACDLDNTLLYSYKHKANDDVCVEWNQDKPQGFMLPTAYELIRTISDSALIVPVTTRSIEQYRRIQWPDGCTPTYALTTNGGILLKKSEIDDKWLRDAQQSVAPYRDEINRMYNQLCELDLFIRCRIVDDSYLFVYCKHSTDIDECADRFQQDTTLFVRASGRKLYFFPPSINKGTAVRKIKRSLSPDILICAGDSRIDVPMLQEADIALVPNEYIAKLVGGSHVEVCTPDTPFSVFVLERTLETVNGI